MIEKGLSRIGKPLSDINAAIENVGKLEVSRMEKIIAGLATIAGASPMLGFLGTVIGMIKAFYDMSMAGNNIDISMLSGGIISIFCPVCICSVSKRMPSTITKV